MDPADQHTNKEVSQMAIPAKQNNEKTGDRQRRVEDKGEAAKIGNLTKALELRFAQSGTAYARSSIAVDQPKEPGNWSGERETHFYELTLFGSLAENAAHTFQKGDRVVVVGRAELEHWTDDEGKERTSKKIVANGIGPDVRFTTATIERAKRRTAAAASRQAGGEQEDPFKVVDSSASPAGTRPSGVA
jgi:single stranded DNA-binding protein